MVRDDVYVAVRRDEIAALRRLQRVAKHALLMQATGSGHKAIEAIWLALDDPALNDEAPVARRDGVQP
jgi:hypothetical protein